MSEHPELRALLGREDPFSDRPDLRVHLEGCAECRARIAQARPELLFSLLGSVAPPSDLLDRLSRRVDAEVSASESGVLPRRRSFRLASMAASLLLAAVLGAYLWTARAPTDGARQAVLSPLGVAAADVSEPTSTIELISSPGEAQVMNLSIGDTQLVMIFDEALEL